MNLANITCQVFFFFNSIIFLWSKACGAFGQIQKGLLHDGKKEGVQPQQGGPAAWAGSGQRPGLQTPPGQLSVQDSNSEHSGAASCRLSGDTLIPGAPSPVLTGGQASTHSFVAVCAPGRSKKRR